MSKYKNADKEEKESPYSKEFRNHTEKDWIAFRKGEPRSRIVPPPNGWVCEEAQHRQWLKRKAEYEMAADENIRRAEEKKRLLKK